jgi:site-specific DNA-methyltransferase (adenine-specific)
LVKILELNKIYNEDCIGENGMCFIPDKSVDMILCDLPYGTTQNKWDNIIPFESLWKEYNRVIKDNGAMIFTGQSLFSVNLIKSNEKYYRYTLIWEKTKAGGFLNAKRMPLRAHEDIIVFYKKLPTYNPQMVEGKSYIKKAITNGDGKNYGKFDRVGTININKGMRYPRSVIKISNDNHGSLHPTQKPVALFEYLIKTYTNKGEIVLDNCMGSGTTAIACMNTKRNYIGFEWCPDDPHDTYFKLANKRIEEHLDNIKSV